MSNADSGNYSFMLLSGQFICYIAEVEGRVFINALWKLEKYFEESVSFGLKTFFVVDGQGTDLTELLHKASYSKSLHKPLNTV